MCSDEFDACVHIRVSLHSVGLYIYTRCALSQQKSIKHTHTHTLTHEKNDAVTVYFELISLKCFNIGMG